MGEQLLELEKSFYRREFARSIQARVMLTFPGHGVSHNDVVQDGGRLAEIIRFIVLAGGSAYFLAPPGLFPSTTAWKWEDNEKTCTCRVIENGHLEHEDWYLVGVHNCEVMLVIRVCN